MEFLSNTFKIGYIYHISTFVSLVFSLVLIHPNIATEFVGHFNSYIKQAYIHLFIGYFLSWIYIYYEEDITKFGYKTCLWINKISMKKIRR